MSLAFLNPLGLLLLAALPLVFLLNLYRRRRVKINVGSNAIWREVLKDREAAPSSRKRIFGLVVMLQMLAVAALALALSDPILGGEEKGRRFVVLLDASASMKTASNGRTRFDVAKTRVLEFAGTLESGDRAMLLVAPSGEGGFEFMEPAAFKNEVEKTSPTDAPLDIEESLASAALTASDANASLVAFTDSPAPVPAGFPEERYSVRPAGQPSPNLAVTALSARGESAYVEVRNYSSANAEFVLSVKAAGGGRERALANRTVKIKTNGTFRDVFSIPATENFTLVEAALEAAPGENALASDDRAWLCRTGRDPLSITVGLFGDPPAALEKALAAVTGGDVVRVLSPSGTENFDWRVYPGEAPEVPPSGNVLLVNPAPGEYRGVKILEEVAVRGSRGYHDSPLGEEVVFGVPGLEKVRIAEGPGLRPVTVAETPARTLPAIFLRRTSEGILACVAFDVDKTAWPEDPGFPVFFARLFEYAVSDGTEWKTFKTGEPITAGGTVPFETGEVRLPGEEKGLKTVAGGGVVMVSLLSREESNTLAAGTVLKSAPPEVETSARVENARRLWAAPFAAALALILAAWALDRGRLETRGEKS